MPILPKSTPEGARDFIVPRGYTAGKFCSCCSRRRSLKRIDDLGFDEHYQIARMLATKTQGPTASRSFSLRMSFAHQEMAYREIEGTPAHVFKLIEAEPPGTMGRVRQRAEAMPRYGSDKLDLGGFVDGTGRPSAAVLAVPSSFALRPQPRSKGETALIPLSSKQVPIVPADSWTSCRNL